MDGIKSSSFGPKILEAIENIPLSLGFIYYFLQFW